MYTCVLLYTLVAKFASSASSIHNNKWKYTSVHIYIYMCVFKYTPAATFALYSASVCWNMYLNQSSVSVRNLLYKRQ